jgi:hypothetical protein
MLLKYSDPGPYEYKEYWKMPQLKEILQSLKGSAKNTASQDVASDALAVADRVLNLVVEELDSRISRASNFDREEALSSFKTWLQEQRK